MAIKLFSFDFLNGILSEDSSSSFFSVESIGPQQPTFSVLEMVKALQNPDTRDRALQLLSTDKDPRGDQLAPLLWRTFGTINVLLEEVIATYRIMSTPQLTDKVATRVCNALSLLQKVASHPETKQQFMRAKIPQYLYPVLNTMEGDRAHEYVRLASLGVIASMLKDDSNDEAVKFLLGSEVLLPYVLRCMIVGAELSKTVAVYIIHRILLNREGLRYCCNVAERFFAVAKTLARMVDELPVHVSSKKLLKHIISCYVALSKNPKARDGLVACFPRRLADGSFYHLLNISSSKI
ncbi:CCR4-NOT transcription complex subunit 9-like [Tripterygium wilfordii]|uniref:CCR4-NOT transcription complex subunit 9-like n=1 Tax=Tripterygium wilfordii TaxID=458696 RepID=UPI0018F817A2|nr:CCR4-NOT transcription complex subunit 9-like [Tripterygium wilfordii]XP_038713274.1 CCR4-NOT transcription complex subunit 9-like [Tripterygium wilfordii]